VLLIGLLVAKRLAYHLTFLVSDPFALVTFSDGMLYEQAARDIAAAPPLGTAPFYLQGLYAYLLALPMALTPQVVVGLLLQLVLAILALWLFHRTATAQLGPLAGALSTAVLLSSSEFAFYENKFLSVSLGTTCNIFALWAFCRCLPRRIAGSDHAAPDPRSHPLRVLLAGACAGLAVLARPNLVLALPFAAVGLLVVARAERRSGARAALVFALGVLIAVAPMAARNLVVVGAPDVFPSHAGGIPFYIGNNPDANGRWSTAGGLVTGQVSQERGELARRLGLQVADPAKIDRAVGEALYAKAFAYIRAQPVAWLGLLAKKLWYTLGNHRFVRDYDLRGEAELIGALHEWGLPFGIALGLGMLGFVALAGRARRVRPERARLVAVASVLAGQLSSTLAANVLVFTSAQNRVPLWVPLAFVSGPGLLAVYTRIVRQPRASWHTSIATIVVGAALALQAFWPRLEHSDRPSSVHYYNLAAVEEGLGRDASAEEHFRRAAERNPTQPMFHLSHARVLRRLGRVREALGALDRLDALPNLDPGLRSASAAERRLLGGVDSAQP
jgi:tetratricopeptide (TPR) repeat protein